MEIGNIEFSGHSVRRKWGVYLIVATPIGKITKVVLYVGKVGDNRDGCNPVISRVGNHFSYNDIHSQFRNAIENPNQYNYKTHYVHIGKYEEELEQRHLSRLKTDEMERELNRIVQQSIDTGTHVLKNSFGGSSISKKVRLERAKLITDRERKFLQELCNKAISIEDKVIRKSPNVETLKLLYVRSGNECAFPKCNHPLFNDKGLYIAELCHISAARRGGERFDENQSNEDRSSPENLLFMCHRHHKETDDVKEFSVDVLKKMKDDHESSFTEKGKSASIDMIRQIQSETHWFWEKQERKVFENEDLKMKVNLKKGVVELYDDLEIAIAAIEDYCDMCIESVSDSTLRSEVRVLLQLAGVDPSVLDKVKYHENPLKGKDWEMHNIGKPNMFISLRLTLRHLKLKVWEEKLMVDPENRNIKSIVDNLRDEFESEYDDAYSFD